MLLNQQDQNTDLNNDFRDSQPGRVDASQQVNFGPGFWRIPTNFNEMKECMGINE
jgi:hypothetical protein